MSWVILLKFLKQRYEQIYVLIKNKLMDGR